MEIKEELDQEILEKIKSSILDIEEVHINKITQQGVVTEVIQVLKHHIK